MKIKAQDKVRTSIVSTTTGFFDLIFTRSVPQSALKSFYQKASTFCLQQVVLNGISHCMSLNLMLNFQWHMLLLLWSWQENSKNEEDFESQTSRAVLVPQMRALICVQEVTFHQESDGCSTSQTFFPAHLSALPRFSALPISRGPWLHMQSLRGQTRFCWNTETFICKRYTYIVSRSDRFCKSVGILMY